MSRHNKRLTRIRKEKFSIMSEKINGTIYLRRNGINGLPYVGQTTVPESARWRKHIEESRRKNLRKGSFAEAIKIFGAENFSLQILAENVPDRETLDIIMIYSQGI